MTYEQWLESIYEALGLIVEKLSEIEKKLK